MLATLDVLAGFLAVAWGSTDFVTRDAASRWADRNPAAVVLAARLTDHADPEVRHRAEIACRRIPARPGRMAAAVFTIFAPVPGSDPLDIDDDLAEWWTIDGRYHDLRHWAVRFGVHPAGSAAYLDAEPSFWTPRYRLVAMSVRDFRRDVTAGGPNRESPTDEQP